MMFRNIYGNLCDSMPVAYCMYKKHKGYLTAKNLHKHECLRKQCPCLRRIQCEFWVSRDNFKRKLKERQEQEHERTNDNV